MTVAADPLVIVRPIALRGLLGAAILALAILLGVVIGETPLPLTTVASR